MQQQKKQLVQKLQRLLQQLPPQTKQQQRLQQQVLPGEVLVPLLPVAAMVCRQAGAPLQRGSRRRLAWVVLAAVAAMRSRQCLRVLWEQMSSRPL